MVSYRLASLCSVRLVQRSSVISTCTRLVHRLPTILYRIFNTITAVIVSVRFTMITLTRSSLSNNERDYSTLDSVVFLVRVQGRLDRLRPQFRPHQCAPQYPHPRPQIPTKDNSCPYRNRQKCLLGWSPTTYYSLGSAPSETRP